MRLKLIIGSAFVLSIVLIVHLFSRIEAQKQEIKRIEGNIAALTTVNRQYATDNGDMAVSQRTLRMTIDELKQANSDLYTKVKALDVSLKRVESVEQISTSTVIEEKVKVDTVVVDGYRNLIAEYRDAHNEITCQMIGDSAQFKLHSKDTLVGVAHIIPKKFLFFKFGVKSINFDVSNVNKKSQVKILMHVQTK